MEFEVDFIPKVPLPSPTTVPAGPEHVKGLRSRAGARFIEQVGPVLGFDVAHDPSVESSSPPRDQSKWCLARVMATRSPVNGVPSAARIWGAVPQWQTAVLPSL